MRVAYVGNFGPAHSTENHVARALEHNGHDVARLQENTAATWADLTALAARPDLVLWTRTGWDWPSCTGWSAEEAHDRQTAALDACAAAGVPTVGFHLDRWWGLNREHQVLDEPFFRCELVATADGGHPGEWARAGVNHVWMPPGVSLSETVPGRRRPEMASEVAFVGSWRPGYHAEWTHRPELVVWLQTNYRRKVRFWPRPGAHAVRGDALRDLYASTKVNVGDSCLAGGATRYWSDRIPETIGRGGFLLHPWVEGIDEHFTDGEHLRLWELDNWGELRQLIDFYLRHDSERRRIAEQGREHVLAHHTYERRMEQLLELVGVPA